METGIHIFRAYIADLYTTPFNHQNSLQSNKMYRVWSQLQGQENTESVGVWYVVWCEERWRLA